MSVGSASASVPRPGEILVAEGNLTRMACSAWLLPSDSGGHLAAGWVESAPSLQGVVEPSEPPSRWPWRLAGDLAPTGGASRIPLDSQAPMVIAVDSGAVGGGDLSHFGAALRSGVESYVEAGRFSPDWFRRDRPLVAFPLLGGGEGGGRGVRGDVLRELLEEADELTSAHGLDLCLVVQGEQPRAAAFAWRERLGLRPVLPADVETAVEFLAERARSGRLVTFMGSGVGAAAGAPDWRRLLERLAQGLGWDERRIADLRDLELLDWAEVIRREMRRRERSLGTAVCDLVQPEYIPLAAMDLAALPVAEAATTNYDRLYEQAAEAVDRPVAAVPFESPAGSGRWLVKLHGCVKHPDKIKLTRPDYLRRDDADSALAGIVQAMLLTKHMLFVGFSLSDPTFHRIVHDVRAAVGEAEDRPDPAPFGTALVLGRAGALKELWEGNIELVELADPGGAEDSSVLASARQAELLLDALLDRCSDPASFLLTSALAGALTPEQQHDRTVLSDLASLTLESPGAGAALSTFLDGLGREGDPAHDAPARRPRE